MSSRVVAALTGLICSMISIAGPLDAYAADLADGYRPVHPKASVDRAARRICVGEHGPDAPPYGFGCLDHWVKVRNTHELIKDNGYVYTVTEETVRRRYPPQVYAPGYEALNPYENGYAAFGQRLFLGCSLCD